VTNTRVRGKGKTREYVAIGPDPVAQPEIKTKAKNDADTLEAILNIQIASVALKIFSDIKIVI